MNIKSYVYYRYLGKGANLPNGIQIQPRDVFGLTEATDDTYYIVHPGFDIARSLSKDRAVELASMSRKFTADPSALFKSSFDFTPKEEMSRENKAKQAPTAAVQDAPKARPKPTPVRKQVSLEKEDAELPDGTDDSRIASVLRSELANVTFAGMSPIAYTPSIYPGGTANDYAVQPVTKCGSVALEVMGIEELRRPDLVVKLNGINPPDYVLKDIQQNVMPGIGLNVPLPFKRLYVGLTSAGATDSGGSHIATYNIHGFLYGAIVLDPRQLIKYLGGFNSLSAAHVITHELAHFVDNTMIRNVDRMRFDQAIRGKKVHPDSLRAATIHTVPDEHFATLAELLVWGNSLRNVFTLNGIEVVAKYFENRYVSKEDIDSRKI